MYNFIDGDFFESLSDYSFGDIHSEAIYHPSKEILKMVFSNKKNPIFFIDTGRLPYLFRELEKFPNDKCRIISHNSDITSRKEILKYIPKNVEKLWCQNYNYQETDVIKSLPIGLERQRWYPDQRKQEIIKKSESYNIERSNLIYMNFNTQTNPLRGEVYNILKKRGFVNIEMVGNGGDYNNYINSLKSHLYVISPPGNGIDCHRTWEAIYCGCIPVVLNSHFTQNIYKDMNVLVVDSYCDLSIELLLQKKDEFDKNTDKIWKQYWKNEILKNV